MWIGLVVAALSAWYVKVTAAHLFRGWGDWLILFSIMMGVIAVGWYIPIRRMAAAGKLDGRAMARRGGIVVAFLLAVLAIVSWWLGSLSFGPSHGEQGTKGIDNFMEVASLLAAAVAGALLLLTKKWGTEQYWKRLAAKRKLRKVDTKLRRLHQSGLQRDLPPHLLFNSLGVARALTRRDPQKARQAMTLISELAKYYVRKCKLPQIPLGEELMQVERLRQLYTLSMDRDIEMEIHAPETAHHTRIIPMLLVLLLENMMKHAVLTDPERPARLFIKRIDNRTEIVATNHVVDQSEEVPEGLGIALHHIRKQLGILYPKQNGMETSLGGGVFEMRMFFIN